MSIREGRKGERERRRGGKEVREAGKEGEEGRGGEERGGEGRGGEGRKGGIIWTKHLSSLQTETPPQRGESTQARIVGKTSTLSGNQVKNTEDY